MSTLLQRGFRLLNRCMEPAAAESVRYLRGVDVIADGMGALVHKQQIALMEAGGTTAFSRDFQWQLKRADLKHRNVPIAPARNDRIEWSSGGHVYVFQVLPDPTTPTADVTDPRSEWITANAKLMEVR